MIYFVLAKGSKRVKIGYTKSGVESRIASLSTGCPTEPILILTKEGDQLVEANYHQRFKSLRAVGEWFDLSHDLLDLLAWEIIALTPGRADVGTMSSWIAPDSMHLLHVVGDEIPAGQEAGWLWAATGYMKDGNEEAIRIIHGWSASTLDFAAIQTQIQKSGLLHLIELVFPWKFPAFLTPQQRDALIERLNAIGEDSPSLCQTSTITNQHGGVVYGSRPEAKRLASELLQLFEKAYRRGFQQGHGVGIEKLATEEEVMKWRFQGYDKALGPPGTMYAGQTPLTLAYRALCEADIDGEATEFLEKLFERAGIQ